MDTYTIDDTLPATERDAFQAGWQYLAEGAARTVYTHPSRPNVVLKMVNTGGVHERQNRYEVLTWENVAGGPFEHLFAPVLAARSDYTTSLVRREPYPSVDEDPFGDWPEVDYGPAERLTNEFIGDIHENNVAGIMDDYGNLVYTKVLDYGL